MITTSKFQLTSNEFLKIILSVYLKKRWWYFPLIWTFAILFSVDHKIDSFQRFFIYFAIFYPILFLYRYWSYANSKDNKIYLLERYFEIYEDRLVGFLEDGSESTIRCEHFVKFINLKNIYLLYISKNQFIFIPKDAFQTSQDKEWFEKNITLKIKR